MNFDKSAVHTAVAIAALSALVVGAVNIGVDEVKAILAERRAKRKERL